MSPSSPNIPAQTPASPDTATETERRILDVAIALFLDEGFERTTIERVARSAMVSKATIYGRHLSKEGLFAAALAQACDNIRNEGDDAPPAAPEALRAALFRFGMDFLDIMWRPETIRLRGVVAIEGLRFPAVATAFMEAGPKRTCRALAERIEAAVGAGLCRPVDAFRTADRYLASLMGIPDLEITMGLRPPMSESERREHVHLALGLLLEGLEP